MRFIPALDAEHLDRYEVADGAGLLGIANEKGDITAYVTRADGTRGHAYGGPVYDPPEFLNICQRCPREGFPPYQKCETPPCRLAGKRDLTEGELVVATAMARKVGWLS